MKKLIFSAVICLLSISTIFAQSQRNDYRKLDYIHVDQNHAEQFLSLAKQELKSNFAKLIDDGKIKSWRLYAVRYPGGEKSDYNYVSVTSATSLDDFDDNMSNITSIDFVPQTVAGKSKEQLKSMCGLVKSELWKIENKITESDDVTVPSKYMTMDYMDVTPGKEYDYLMLEDEIAKPIHKERIDMDRMSGWEVYSLILPGGTEYDYDYATGNYFNKVGYIEFGFTTEVIKQAMGENSNVSELFDTIYQTRDLVKTEMWELVDHVK